MNILIFLAVTFLVSTVHAGDWTVIGKDTLSFKGYIETSEVEKFKQVFNSDIKKIIVDSGGGNAEVGLAIGELIADANVDIEVQGICMSSCANYIFVAGQQKRIRGGIVGYHGNITALMKATSKEELINQMKQSGLSDQQANDFYQHYISNVLPREEAFFSRLGVSQDLFDRTQRPDKGMGAGVYVALLPKPETFERYGIQNVSGEQSQYVIDNDPRVTKYTKLGAPVLID